VRGCWSAENPGRHPTGEVVEDYAALTGSQRGHGWVPVRRWAVALDDGRLVFADTEDHTADSGTQQFRAAASAPLTGCSWQRSYP
jgi:hypothetical protein